MAAYTKPQQRKKEESERLRGERDQIKFIDLLFERLRPYVRRLDVIRQHIVIPIHLGAIERERSTLPCSVKFLLVVGGNSNR